LGGGGGFAIEEFVFVIVFTIQFIIEIVEEHGLSNRTDDQKMKSLIEIFQFEYHNTACSTSDTKCNAFQTCLLTAASANPLPSAGNMSTEAERKTFLDEMKQRVVNCENSSGFNPQHHANNGTNHG
jgi:hypothetical protein